MIGFGDEKMRVNKVVEIEVSQIEVEHLFACDLGVIG